MVKAKSKTKTTTKRKPAVKGKGGSAARAGRVAVAPAVTAKPLIVTTGNIECGLGLAAPSGSLFQQNPDSNVESIVDLGTGNAFDVINSILSADLTSMRVSLARDGASLGDSGTLVITLQNVPADIAKINMLDVDYVDDLPQ